MNLLFLNHTPYKDFWSPLRERFQGFPIEEMEIFPFWDRTGDFRVWQEYSIDPQSSPIIVGHSHGCLFLPEIAAFFQDVGSLPSIWIEPCMVPLIGLGNQAVEDVRCSDSDVILTKLSELVCRPLEGSELCISECRLLDEYVHSFQNSLNYSKALMIEHARLCARWDEISPNSWSWEPSLFLLGSQAQKSRLPKGLDSHDRRSLVKEMENVSIYPFLDESLLPLISSIEGFSAMYSHKIPSEGRENVIW